MIVVILVLILAAVVSKSARGILGGLMMLVFGVMLLMAGCAII
jgi:hypothetical protein